jgi:SAM-dependent methyltransferase
MATDRAAMEQNDNKIVLNIGCGFRKTLGAINVDGYASCNPDVLWNLNDIPWPWEDNSIYYIQAYHIFEHIVDWWAAFNECARILRPEGILEIRMPDASSDSALTYRDHLHVFNLFSFHGTLDALRGREVNAWFNEQPPVPLHLTEYWQVPFREYFWMPNWMLKFCSKHLRNFIWEQRFKFKKANLAPEDVKLKIAGKYRKAGKIYE